MTTYLIREEVSFGYEGLASLSELCEVLESCVNLGTVLLVATDHCLCPSDVLRKVIGCDDCHHLTTPSPAMTHTQITSDPCSY